MNRYFYDESAVRYELYKTDGGGTYNWLFFPGGPGADSCYFKGLIDHLCLPGNSWLIDFPGNGSHVPDSPVDFDSWLDLFPKVVRSFDRPVLVGHSFGGMLPLLFPELEDVLEGLVILNSTPTLWLEAALSYSKQFELPDLSQPMQAFTLNPSQETFEAALDACMPYYFPQATLEEGRDLLSQIPFQYLPAVWWQKKAVELNFNAEWIPLNVPTSIVGTKYDCICPFSLFREDSRFQRPNIALHYIEDAGHIPWVENIEAVRQIFEELCVRIQKKSLAKPEFAVIYRGYVKPEKEKEYLRLWKRVAKYFVTQRGALGSTLHKTKENMWVAYSRWPSQESRDASWPTKSGAVNPSFPQPIQEAISQLKGCLEVDKELPEIAMSVVDVCTPDEKA